MLRIKLNGDCSGYISGDGALPIDADELRALLQSKGDGIIDCELPEAKTKAVNKKRILAALNEL